MNIKVLHQIQTGATTHQEGELITLPDADALACIKAGAAEPADRRARRIVAETVAAEQAAARIDPAVLAARQKTHDSGGFVRAIQARISN